MLRVCKGNAPVSVKKECVFCQTIKRGCGYGCVCLSPSTKSLVSVCNGSNLESANKRRAPRCMCACARKIQDEYGCVYVRVCHFPSPINSYLGVCVYMYMYVNTTERMRLQKAVVLVLIMKYFVLKISLIFPGN